MERGAFGGPWFAWELMRPEFFEAIASDQHTSALDLCAHQRRSGRLADATDEALLSTAGRALWAAASAAPPKGTFPRYRLERSHTGGLGASCCAPAQLASHHNLHIVGELNGRLVETSSVCLLAPHWCLTASGSKYALGERVIDARLPSLDARALGWLGWRPFTVQNHPPPHLL